MNRWEEQLNNHQIHSVLESISEAISTDFDSVDENEPTEKRRLVKLISMYTRYLSTVGAEVMPFNQLDSLVSQLNGRNVVAHVQSYAEKGNVSDLIGINDVLTNNLTQLCLLGGLIHPEDAEYSIKELEKLFDSTTETLVGTKDTILADLSDLESEIKRQQAELEELRELIRSNKSDTETHITNWQGQFSKAQESRSQDFNDWKKEFTSEKEENFSEILGSYQSELKNTLSAFSTKINELIQDSKDKHQSILDLYELTAGDSVGAGYIKDAGDEKKMADRWRLISVTFIIATVVWIFMAYKDTISRSNKTPLITPNNQEQLRDDVSSNIDVKTEASSERDSSAERIATIPWYRLFLTFSLSGVLLWGSAYSAQQSTKHRKNEVKNRRFALEVKAIDPFISSLDESDRKQIKKDLTEKIFGNTIDDDDTTVIDEHAYKVVADAISKILSKLPR